MSRYNPPPRSVLTQRITPPPPPYPNFRVGVGGYNGKTQTF